MKDIENFLAELSRNGVRIWEEDGALHYSAPIGMITAEKRSILQEYKAEILDLLRNVNLSERLSLTAPFQALPGSAEIPLSFAQSRLWFLNKLEGKSGLYNIPYAIRLKGALKIDALEASLNQIIARHEIMRSRFAIQGEEPHLEIVADLAVNLPVVDLRGLGLEEREEELRRLLIEDGRRAFDLEKGPLFRVLLYCLSDEEHVILLNLHHAIFDEWSQGVLFRELGIFYRCSLSGDVAEAPELEVQYGDYAAWQREWLQGEELEKQMSYWREKLEGAPMVLDLPTDRPRPAVLSYRGGVVRRLLPVELQAGMRRMSREWHTTLFISLLAAYQVLLYRYSGQQEVLVGTPITNRRWAEVENLIGFFLNTLVLRGDVSGGPSFREYLGRMNETVLEAFDHQDLPFEKLVEELKPERDLSKHPLFQTAFVLHPESLPKLELEGLDIDTVWVDYGWAKFDLTLYLVESEGGLEARMEYSTDLFDEDTIERMLGHYEELLKGILENPDRRVDELPLLREEERREILEVWSKNRREYPGGSSVQALFEVQVEQRPDALAAVFGNEELSYAELNSRANQVAMKLREMGVGLGCLVGLYIERSVEMVIGMLGILKAGGAYVPLDPSYPRARLRFMLQDSGAVVLLSRVEEEENLDVDNVQVQSIEACILGEGEADVGNLDDVNCGGDLAYVMYTSGSTGEPKGIGVPHRAINRLVCNTDYVKIREGDRIAQASNASFDAATFEVWGALLNGGCLVGMKAEEMLNPAEIGGRLREKGIRTMFVTTALMNQIAAIEPGAFKSLRDLMFGGEAVTPEWVRQIIEAGGPERLLNVYGPTESTTFTTWQKVEGVEVGASNIAIGKPVANTQVYVLDNRMNPAPVGVAGELYIGGDGLAVGYHARPGLTAECFVPNPYGGRAGERMYRTGDQVRWQKDGSIEFLGRLDQQVKLRGFRIELGEIEAALNGHAGVVQAVVMMREVWGEGNEPADKRLVAYVVRKEERRIGVQELQAYLQLRLPEYMLPAAYRFLDELPLNPNGKVDRQALPEPEMEQELEERGFVGPRNELEEKLCRLWEQVLGVQPVGVHDNFFHLGGHSLLAIQLVSSIRDQLDLELSLAALFRSPTIETLARMISMGNIDPKEQTPLSLERRKTGPLSFDQERLWFMNQLEGETGLYNVPCAFRLKGLLDIRALEASLKCIMARHEILRTSFSMIDGKPAQVVATEVELPIAIVDLGEHSEAKREALVRRLAVEAGREAFNLKRAPLFRIVLYRLSDQEHVLLFNLHHSIFDEWSQEVFFRELNALYSGEAMGEKVELPALPLQYIDFAIWQRDRMRGAILEKQLAYWRGKLAGAPETLNLPVDFPPRSIPGHRGAEETRKLTPELLQKLNELSRVEQVTLFTLFLAAFQVLLYRYTRQQDLLVGTPIANRLYPHVGGMIGFFLNNLVIRGNLRGNPTFRHFLKQLNETIWEAFENQDLPFERLVEELAPERYAGRLPFLQAIFVMHPASLNKLVLEDLEITPLDLDYGWAKTDLTLIISDRSDGISVKMVYDRDLFEAATISRWLSHFERLLEGITQAPDQPVDWLPLLPETERQRILTAFNDNPVDVRANLCLHKMFEAQAAQTPTGLALASDEDGDFGEKRLSYAELNVRANQLARYLRKLGVGAEVLVGLYFERSLNMVVAMLAVLKAGGAYLPLDLANPAERLKAMLYDSNVSLLLTQSDLVLELDLNRIPRIDLDLEWEMIARENSNNLDIALDVDNLAYVIYTSGSTGGPKGVQVAHRGLSNTNKAVRQIFDLQTYDRILHTVTFSFDAATSHLFVALISGAAVYLVTGDARLDPSELARLLFEQTITHVSLPASVLAALPEVELPALRTISSGAEFCSAELAARWAIGRRFFNMYGPTEVSIIATCAEYVSGDQKLPIGRPLPNLQAYILDDHFQPVPVGVAGELCLAGIGLARGYLHAPAFTAEKFVPNPFSMEPGGRLYKTGDLARFWPDGNIEFLGRIDHQVKLRGFRIELGEIEKALEEHNLVKQAVVLLWQGKRDGRLGVDKRLAAYIVPQTGVSLAKETLRGYLKIKLPAYMLPAIFVFLDEMPLNPNGKVNRQALYALIDLQPTDDEAYVAPSSAIERLLSGIWAVVLDVERVGTEDNFFDLGGHSLLATRLHALVEEVLHLELPLQALFEYPTVAEFAQELLRTSPDREKLEKTAELVLEIAQLSETEAQARMETDAIGNITKVLENE